MAAETGHHPNRSYIDRDGRFHLNGAAFYNDAESDISGTLENFAATFPCAIPFTTCRVWDAIQTVIPGTAASDDLAIINGTFLTSAPSIKSSDSKAATTTQKTRFLFPVPVNYVAGSALTLRLNAGMVTTVSDTSATIDAQVARVAAPTVDVCATAAQSINSLTAANKDFVITPTNVVAGDILDVVLTVAIVDGATATAVIGQINTATFIAG